MRFFSSAIFLLLALTAILFANSSWANSSTQSAKAQGDDSAFEEAMESASGAHRSLRRSKFNPDAQADNLKAIQKLEMALLTAKANMDSINMSPNAKTKFGTDKKAYHTAFRTDLIKALMTSLQLEMAILTNDTEKAKELFRKLGEIRNSSHELFETNE